MRSTQQNFVPSVEVYPFRKTLMAKLSTLAMGLALAAWSDPLAPSCALVTNALGEYLVATYADLRQVGVDSCALDRAYRVVADIDASSSATDHCDSLGKCEGFAPIGCDTLPFSGRFRGAGHSISNLVIQRPHRDNIGLFAVTSDTAQIDSLGLHNGTLAGRVRVGGLVGVNAGSITQCHMTGNVHGQDSTGGLVGLNRGAIRTSYVTGNVTGKQMVGGLVGRDSGLVRTSYTTGTVVGDSLVGGLVGWSDGAVSMSYATGPVVGKDGVGGLVGWSTGTVSRSYATGAVSGLTRAGGLVGASLGKVTMCLWDSLVVGQNKACGLGDSCAAMTLVTREMTSREWFMKPLLDSTAIWRIRPDSTYPALRSVDNAPFAFADTLVTGKKASLARLLKNDFDVETVQAKLVLHVDSLWGGTTDSSLNVAFPANSALLDTLRLVYRLGEARTSDTLWGNRARAVLVHGLEGNGTQEDPFLVDDYSRLKLVGTLHPVDKTYRLTADIDASASSTENCDPVSGVCAGFTPIGYPDSDFKGRFHGGGHVVRHLTIRRPLDNYVGLFASSGDTSKIDSLGVVSGSVTGKESVGGLVGLNAGTIHACFSMVSVSGLNSVGGLVGINDFLVHASFATGAVSGTKFVGGLVGLSDDTVRNAYATGNVTGQQYVGGLVGYTTGRIDQCYATGSVTGGQIVGGIVGETHYMLLSSYATGPVSGSSSVGGLAGANYLWVKSSYWDSSTTRKSVACGGNVGVCRGEDLSTTGMRQVPNLKGLLDSSSWTLRADSTYPALREVDNAPFAFSDSLICGPGTFPLSRLLANDFDYETLQNHLILHVDSLSGGTTDSSANLSFPSSAVLGTTLRLVYRVGEVRRLDTLWGNRTRALVTRGNSDPTTGIVSRNPSGRGLLSDRIDAMEGNVLATGAFGAGKGELMVGVHTDLERSLSLNLEIPAVGTIFVAIFDRLGTPVISLEREVTPMEFFRLRSTQDGRRVLPLSWNLRAQNGVPVASGIYLWRIRVGSTTGQPFEVVKTFGVTQAR